MSDNRKSPLIVKNADELPSESVSLPLKMQLIDVTYLSTATSNYPLHNHRAVQVIVPLKTAAFDVLTLSSVSSRQKIQKLNSENVVITPAFQPHTLLWNIETELVMFDLEPEFIEQAAGEEFRGGAVEIKEEFFVRDSFITQMGNALYSEFRHPSAVGEIYIESLATTLAVHLLRNYSVRLQNFREFSGGLSGARLRWLKEYIDVNLDQNISLSEIAETVGMSSYYFSRALKKSTGFAPHTYIVCRRIERAKQLLTATKLPIIEIALAVGYNNHSHFSTQFRKLVGISPKAYREK